MTPTPPASWAATAAARSTTFNAHGKVDIQVGTLSKAIGALGGYVCGSRDLIDFLYHRARPFLFSTSHPPSVAATCIAAFDILESEPDRIDRLWANTAYFKQQLAAAGFNIGGVTTPASETPITPILIGDGRQTMDFSRALFDAGLMATGIAFPTVQEGKARIRTIMTSEHTRPQIDQSLEILTTTARTPLHPLNGGTFACCGLLRLRSEFWIRWSHPISQIPVALSKV